MPFYYAGIGSRETPSEIGQVMSDLSSFLETQGGILHSGGADGADSFFESGVKNPLNKKIFLPWVGFNKNPSLKYFYTNEREALAIAEKYHKSYQYLSYGAKKLMNRNGFQVLGEDLKSPVTFVICWTPDGCESNEKRRAKTGGTGQAISIADDFKIPIYNLFNLNAMDRLNIQLVKMGKEPFIEKVPFDESVVGSVNDL